MCAVKNIGQLSRSGMQAFQEGQVHNAEFLLHQALVQAKSLNSPVLEAKILNNIGLVASLTGKKDLARETLATALATLEKKVVSGSLHDLISKNLAENAA